MAERVLDYTTTKLITDPKKLKKAIQSPHYKSSNFLTTEDGEIGIHEVTFRQRTIQDQKPVHSGVAILQHSKLMMLQFVDFLMTYLKPGSFSLCYTGMYT